MKTLTKYLQKTPDSSMADGRRQRSARTRHAILDAYLALLRENSKLPKATHVAKRAGCSVRSVFEHFPDVHTLRVAVMDHALSQGVPRVFARVVTGDRQQRLRIHVETRAMVCEGWLPLWRAVTANQADSAELVSRTAAVRQATLDRIELAYKPELSTLPPVEQRLLVLVIECLIAFESWGRMREDNGLSVEEICTAWMGAIDRLLPPTPTSSPP